MFGPGHIGEGPGQYQDPQAWLSSAGGTGIMGVEPDRDKLGPRVAAALEVMFPTQLSTLTVISCPEGKTSPPTRLTVDTKSQEK